ncbi:hypothetical protein BKA01_002834 [Pseudonocardia eucalypti]|nr:hypothetical protein [Pseudonocardia eucalypti]
MLVIVSAWPSKRSIRRLIEVGLTEMVGAALR